MKERPICYSRDMTVARLAGRKSVTRRLLNPQPEFCGGEGERDDLSKWGLHSLDSAPKFSPVTEWRCPKGAPGDRLWTQEVHTITACAFDTFGGIEAWRLAGYYDAGLTPFDIVLNQRESDLFTARKKKRVTVPPRFMYRSLSRGLDEIVSVRVERLNDISEADCYAEGIERPKWPNLGSDVTRRDNAVNAYRSLWDSIHGAQYPWASNPFVFVISVRKIQ